MNKFIFYTWISWISLSNIFAQGPSKRTSGEIYDAIKKLNVLGSVLYVAAHPDDENTNLISYLSNERHLDARYLSLTRGDGGQNLIGSEQAELLGVIRTQELLRARGVDGGKQAFSRANDFGFSKHPTETLKKWDKQKVLADAVWAIRKYQPDVMINRFTTSTERPNHGHHTASAMIGLEAFELAGDPKAFPEQLKYVSIWKPTRYLMNISWWFYGGRDKFDLIDKSKWLKMDIGAYYPLKGKSNTEIAADSRSQHRCQGMGTLPERGEYSEWFEVLKGEKVERDILEGVNTTWSRIPNGKLISVVLDDVIKEYNFDNPAASVPKLLDVYKMIEALPDGYWKSIKIEEIKDIIRWSMGLYVEASAADFSATNGEKMKINFEVINRSNVNVVLKSLSIQPVGQDSVLNLTLVQNKNNKFKTTVTIPKDLPYTNAYWLNKSHNSNMYEVDEQTLIGLPETPRALKVKFSTLIADRAIDFFTDVVYKFEDPVRGEVFRPFEITPPVFVALDNKAYIFVDNQPKQVKVTVKAGGQDSTYGTLSLKLPAGWRYVPEKHYFYTKKKGEEKTFSFEIYAPSNVAEGDLSAIATINNQEFNKKLVTIQYEHIPTQMVLLESKAKLTKVEVKKENRKIAYIMGAGDEIPQSLRQIGYEVAILEDKDINSENLKKYEVLIMGIRAYNTIERLKVHQPKLYEFVEKGGTMIVQYNNNFDIYLDELAPFKLKISRDRVTEEDAAIRFLAPNHEVLNTPNKISLEDFNGWVQERGLYFPSEWDAKAEAILSCNDANETPKNGGLLVAPYGKGYYVYTGLAFFRQLPAGVPGAYRLFTNIISLKQKEIAKTPVQDVKKEVKKKKK
jgi:LmbE family N-acetylglucosaminyl deacetylase